MKRYSPIFPKQWITLRLNENLKLSDLMKNAGISSFTDKWRKDRQKIKGPGNKSAKLVQMKVNRSKDYITFFFLSEPTYEFDTEVVTLPSMTFKSDNVYTQEIRILDFFKLLETNPNLDKENISIDNIKEVLRNIDIQLWCDCGSFWWQGHDYYLTMFDAAIYPCNIEPKVWNLKHKENNLICKHLTMIISQSSFFLNLMSSMIYKYVKSK